MRTLLLFLFFMVTTVLLAQRREEGFNYNFKPTPHAPRYYVITEKTDSGWHRKAYYLPEASMAMEGWYKDEEAKVPHGKEVWYHTSKFSRSIGQYIDGKKAGAWLTYDEEGRIKDSTYYVDGHQKGISLSWNKDGYQIDSTNFDGAGNGVQVSWYSEGQLRAAGRWVSDTNRQGRWQYYHANGQLRATVDYTNGERTAAVCYDEAGQPLPDCEEKEATFPSGDKGWRSFVEKNLKPSVPVVNGAPNGQYLVVMQFVVDKDGQITDIRPLTKFGYGMEAEVERMLKRSPRWIPAQQFGSKVKAYRRQPITFVVSGR